MKLRLPGGLTSIGGCLIAASGLVSFVDALGFGAVLYEPDPHGIFGHVGMVAGLAAVGIGAFLFWFGRLVHKGSGRKLLAGVVSIVAGHLGAAAGALLVGTAGLLCCYTAGAWFLVLGIRERRTAR